jgi:hypothetical protein
MQDVSGLASIEEERAELHAAIEAMGRSSRLAQLLHYMGDKYFAGQSDQLSEYTIATEVFGRSKTAFDASEDAIARVEAHRLRKRLTEFYKGPGKDHPIQVAIPPGSYVPAFTHRFAGPHASGSSGPEEQATLTGAHSAPGLNRDGVASLDHNAESIASKSGLRRFVLFAVLGSVLLCALVIAILLFSHARGRTHSAAEITPAMQSGAPETAQTAVRILAGYSGAPRIDSGGQVWGADRFFHGGGPWRRSDSPIARTRDPFLFQYWRMGDSTYNIPLRPGVYELHFYFVTADSSSDNSSTFTVRINGNLTLSGFDINSDAMGNDIADERIFRDVSPAADGMLHISFASERGAPQINAIEVVPGIPHKQLPIRLVMQRTPYTDHNGQLWQPDNYYLNGRLSDERHEIEGSSDPDLFATERYGHFNYAIPVDPRDRYTLILHFVEFYFGTQTGGGGGVGNRVFKVMCNGEDLLDNFDIYKEAGSLHVLTKTFYHLKPSAQGKLNLTFEPIANNATVSGIEVLDENK